jgi:hypothetical protein
MVAIVHPRKASDGQEKERGYKYIGMDYEGTSYL